MVVAIPAPRVVEGDHEEVVALESLQHVGAVGPTGERVAQVAAQLGEDGGGQQERADVVGLPVEDLFDEIVQDEAVAAGERLDEAGDLAVAAVAGGERRQLEAHRPPLGAGLERGHQVGRQPELHDVVEEPVGLFGGEAQVAAADLDQLAAGTQPGQRQRRVGAGGHGEGDVWRQVLEQLSDDVVDTRIVDHVVVVERQHRGTGHQVEVVDQAGDDRIRLERLRTLEPDERVGADLGHDGLHRCDEVAEEPAYVGVPGVQSQPGDAVLRAAVGPRGEPLGQQRRLAEAGRRRDQHQPGSVGRVEAVGEAATRHEPTARRGQVQLGADDGHLSRGPSTRRGRPSARRGGPRG